MKLILASSNVRCTFFFLDYSNTVGNDRYYHPYTDINIQLENTFTDGQSSAVGNNLPSMDYYQTGYD